MQPSKFNFAFLRTENFQPTSVFVPKPSHQAQALGYITFTLKKKKLKKTKPKKTQIKLLESVRSDT